MPPRLIVFAVVVALALLGCAQMGSAQPSSASAAGCTPSNCRVIVTVTGDCSNANQISVNIDPLPVPRQHHNLKIAWDIQTPGFKWAPAPNGITFTTPPIPPAGEFTNHHDNGDKYDVTDANNQTVPTLFKYDIHLMRSNGSPCAVKDPSIRNGSS